MHFRLCDLLAGYKQIGEVDGQVLNAENDEEDGNGDKDYHR